MKVYKVDEEVYCWRKGRQYPGVITMKRRDNQYDVYFPHLNRTAVNVPACQIDKRGQTRLI